MDIVFVPNYEREVGVNQTRNRRKGTVSVISHDPPFKKRAWA